jgi:hypothetical protein
MMRRVRGMIHHTLVSTILLDRSMNSRFAGAVDAQRSVVPRRYALVVRPVRLPAIRADTGAAIKRRGTRAQPIGRVAIEG